MPPEATKGAGAELVDAPWVRSSAARASPPGEEREALAPAASITGSMARTRFRPPVATS